MKLVVRIKVTCRVPPARGLSLAERWQQNISKRVDAVRDKAHPSHTIMGRSDLAWRSVCVWRSVTTPEVVRMYALAKPRTHPK